MSVKLTLIFYYRLGYIDSAKIKEEDNFLKTCKTKNIKTRRMANNQIVKTK